MKNFKTILLTLVIFTLSTGVIQASSVTTSIHSEHNAIIKEDGTLWTSGYNKYGQLGTGDTTDREEPVQVMSDVKSVALGRNFTLVLKTDGTMWGFGSNLYGQLGTKIQVSKNNFNIIVPRQTMTGIKAIAVGLNYGLALKTTGELYSFGSNSRFQLGIDDLANLKPLTRLPTYEPTLILTDIASISASDYHAAAVKTGGSLYTWGLNSPDNRCGFPINGAFIKTPTKLMDGVLTFECGPKTTTITTTKGNFQFGDFN